MPLTHKIAQGECLSSVADRHGLTWEKIWNDPANAELKRRRGDPNVLRPGDEIVIPDRTLRQESGATEARHRFRAKGVPAKFKVQLMADGEPRADEPYRLSVDGHWTEGTTDGEGFVEAPIVPGARSATLVLGEGDMQEAYAFRLGELDPIDTDEGVAQRLRDLGFGHEQGDGTQAPAGEATQASSDTQGDAAAIRAFQEEEGLAVTGTADQSTRRRLQERFGI